MDKTILVTGGGKGIGRALVEGFLHAGARVATLTRSEPAPFSVSGAEQDRLVTIVGDVTSTDDVRKLIDISLRRFGRIDALINNAGLNRIATFAECDFEDWLKVVNVNLVGTALCTREVLPLMVKAGYGRIVNIVSRSAEDPVSGRTAYSAAKAAVITFTKVLARELQELKAHDVLVNGLIPGPTNTSSHPMSGQKPEAVFPYCRQLVELPRGGPNGRFFRKGKDYPMYVKFNDEGESTPRSYWGHLAAWLRR